MMEKEYCLSLNLGTPNGLEPYGRYVLGRDKHFAVHVFDALMGIKEPAMQLVLHIDLVESEEGVPFVLNVKYFTLDEVAENTSGLPCNCSGIADWKQQHDRGDSARATIFLAVVV